MKITFIGGGNMASAMIGGMLKCGFAANELHVVEPDQDRRQALEQQFGLSTAAPGEPLPVSDAVILAVKPQQLRHVVEALASELGQALILSIAAGIRAETLAQWLPAGARVVRVMPNTPALLQAGMSGVFAAPTVTAADRALSERILRATGDFVWVDDESDIDGITAISGSGPAYIFYFMESLQAAARAQGFPPEVARKLAYQTFAGAVKLALESDEDAATLRARVTSKGGTTERAINALENSQVRSTIIAAAAAAAARSRELGEEFGRDQEL